MQWHCLSCSTTPLTFSSHKPLFSPHLSSHSSFTNFNQFRFSHDYQYLNLMPKNTSTSHRSSMFVRNAYPGVLSPNNLSWISAVSTAILMLVKGTAINRSFLVPLFALQAPGIVVSWMQGEYGAWSAFLALLVRLFFSIPGELELPFLTLVLVIVAPHRALHLRGTQAGAIISLVIAAYMAFQHFTRAGSLQRSFEQGSIVATIAIICITIVPCLLLI